MRVPPLCLLCSTHRHPRHPRPQLSAQEQKDVVAAFNSPAAAQASGIRLAGQKFFTLQANDRSIYGKKAVRLLLRSLFCVRSRDLIALCSSLGGRLCAR